MQYIIKRDYRGSLAGKMAVDLGGGRSVEVTASKRSNGQVICVAIAGRVERCDGYSTFTYAPYSDFNCRVGVPAARCTMKNIEALMDQAVAEMPAILERARAFYNIQEAA
jgi:hypothetical protein